ncbi:MAG TPA: OmpA family protein [Egicoccus sp.]|nr:OmpA family protein [Egicoccus sp.]HSK22831.1 OmpA family protein [Egicoccus sp.]
MTRPEFRAARSAVVVLAIVLAACSGGEPQDEPQVDPTDASEEAVAEDVGEQREAVPAEASTWTIEALDAPQSTAEVRVAEIIVEFDGRVTAEGTVLTLEEPILFDFDSDQLRDGAREPLDDIAEVLAFYPDAPVQVIGHTDDQGSADYNLDLSQRRADVVADALRERGIPVDRLTAEGRGLTEPVAPNDSDEGRAQNRRVEVLIVGVEPPESGGTG